MHVARPGEAGEASTLTLRGQVGLVVIANRQVEHNDVLVTVDVHRTDGRACLGLGDRADQLQFLLGVDLRDSILLEDFIEIGSHVSDVIGDTNDGHNLPFLHKFCSCKGIPLVGLSDDGEVDQQQSDESHEGFLDVLLVELKWHCNLLTTVEPPLYAADGRLLGG